MRAFILWSAYVWFLVSMAATVGLMLAGVKYLHGIHPLLAGLAPFICMPTFLGIGWLLDKHLARQP
jgi:hypothetical protein